METHVNVLIIDLCALLLAPELKARLLLTEADKDGLYIHCYAQLPRENLRYALKRSDFLQYFDGLFYDEIMSNLTSDELRTLHADTTIWMKKPEDVSYDALLPLLPPRRRMMPRALRMQRLLAEGVNFQEDPAYTFTEESDGEAG